MSAVKWKFCIFWIKEAFFLNCAVCSKNICKVSTVDNWNEAFLLHPRLSHNAALLVPCKAVWADAFDYPLKQASSLMPAFSHPFILRLCLFVSAFLHSCLFCVSAGWKRSSYRAGVTFGFWEWHYMLTGVSISCSTPWRVFVSLILPAYFLTLFLLECL